MPHSTRPGQRRRGNAPGQRRDSQAAPAPWRPLAEHARDRRAVVVHDGGLLAALERPARRAQAEAQVGVAAGTDGGLEAPDLRERRAAHRRVGGLREGPARVGERDLLAHRGLQVRVAHGAVARLVGRGLVEDRTGEHAGLVGRRLGEVAVEQVGRREHVGIDEHEPWRAVGVGATIARVVGGLALARRDDPDRTAPRCASAAPGRLSAIVTLSPSRSASVPSRAASWSSCAAEPRKGTTTSTAGRGLTRWNLRRGTTWPLAAGVAPPCWHTCQSPSTGA